jgi:hypothetical protein
MYDYLGTDGSTNIHADRTNLDGLYLWLVVVMVEVVVVAVIVFST